MKHIIFKHSIPFVVLAWLLISVSCDDFIEVDSNSVIPVEDYKIDNPATARNTMFGILAQLQRVADKYVVVGELRGDLLTTTENSTQDLRDIADFCADSLNAYHLESELYAIINSCNYLLSRIDTNVTITNNQGEREKVLKYEMSQAKAIRAWCYLQLLLDYGVATYYTEPIIAVDQPVDGVERRLNTLVPILIADLLPLVPSDPEIAESLPDYGTVDRYPSKQLFIPVRVLLGDLYLYMNEYEQAAQMYYAHLLSNSLTVLPRRNVWTDNTFTKESGNWTSLFSETSEMQTVIQCSADYIESQSHLMDMFDNKKDYLFAPSAVGLNTWETQTYAYGTTVSTQGDLRGPYGTMDMLLSIKTGLIQRLLLLRNIRI